MRIIALIVAVIAFVNLSGAQNSLVGNKGGKWIIFNDHKRVELPSSYHSVGNFDTKGLTYFEEFGRYGLLDENAKVIQIPAFKSILQLGEGYYDCLTDTSRYLIDYSQGNPVFQEYNTLDQHGNTWLKFGSKEHESMLNTVTKERFELGENVELQESKFGYILFRIDDEPKLYNPQGEVIPIGDEGMAYFKSDHIFLEIEGNNKLIYSDQEIILPEDAENFLFNDNELSYRSDGVVTLVTLPEGKEVFSYPCDRIKRISSDVFTYEVNGSVGLIRKNGTVICAPEYNNIIKVDDRYNVWKSSGLGVMSASGELLVPCLYRFVRRKGSFYTLESKLGLRGIFSMKTRSNLLEAVYSKVAISSDKLRGWTNETLKIVQFNEKHEVLNTLILKNTVSKFLVSNGKGDVEIDQRLYGIGWFDTVIPRFDKDGFQTGESWRWGIRQEDKLKSRAIYSTPKYIPFADFSLVPIPDIEHSSAGGVPTKKKGFKPINVFTGKPIFTEPLLIVDTTDLLLRNFSRFRSTKGLGFLKGNSVVEYVNFYDMNHSQYIRYCKSEVRDMDLVDEDDRRGVQVPEVQWDGASDRFLTFRSRDKSYTWVRFNGAQWNFIDTNGNDLFEESFDFIEPFQRGTAINERGGKWGVVTSDSLIIPNKYSNIVRLSDVSDTIFKASIQPNGDRYLDSLTHDISLPIRSFSRSKKEANVVVIGRKKIVINKNYDLVSDESKNARLLGESLYYYKTKKKYAIFGLDGTQYGEIDVKPSSALEIGAIVIKKGSRVGLFNLEGDTILPTEYKSIVQKGNYVFASGKGENVLLDDKFNLVRKCKSFRVIVDKYTGDYALIKPKKTIVYDASNTKIGVVKDVQPDRLTNGVLFQYKKEIAVPVGKDEVSKLPSRVIQVEKLDDYGYLIWSHEDTFFYYSPEWERIESFFHRKDPKYLGYGCIEIRGKEKSQIYSPDTSFYLAEGESTYGEFSHDLLVIHSRKGMYYVDRDFKNPFYRNYKRAEPFIDGYATVKENKGWTVIDTRGIAKCLPVFGEIENKGNHLFTTRKQAVYGLFDSHGNQIVPVEFEIIHVLQNNIIQCIKKGEIFYYNFEGTEISY